MGQKENWDVKKWDVKKKKMGQREKEIALQGSKQIEQEKKIK